MLMPLLVLVLTRLLTLMLIDADRIKYRRMGLRLQSVFVQPCIKKTKTDNEKNHKRVSGRPGRGSWQMAEQARTEATEQNRQCTS